MEELKDIDNQGGRRTKGIVKKAQPGKPLISVVTVVYNGEQTLENTIVSIKQQSYDNIEYVVVDGRSKDATVSIIKKHEADIDYWRSEPDRGIYDAMNKGLRLVNGDWVVFMNSGDRFYDREVISKVAGDLMRSRNEFMVYGDSEIVNGNKRHVQYQRNRHTDLTKSIIHQSIFIKTSYLQAHPYNLKYRIMADYDNLLNVSVPTPHLIRHVDVIVCIYDKTGVSSQPLYRYFPEYYAIAYKRMPFLRFMWFNLYIIPRLLWSCRFYFIKR